MKARKNEGKDAGREREREGLENRTEYIEQRLNKIGKYRMIGGHNGQITKDLQFAENVQVIVRAGMFLICVGV